MGQTLSRFDFVSLVVDAIIGADIYVVAGVGTHLVGPLLLIAWVVGGVVAGVIVLCFAQCAAILPAAGGPYAYVRAAFGDRPARVVGLALYLAEWAALAVFPVAAAGYLIAILGLGAVAVVAFKIVFVSAFAAANLLGVRVAGWVNDALTVGKLIPLAVLVVAAAAFATRDPSLALAHLLPLAPLGWGSFGPALVLVFWAYAGFEIASLPANEVANPRTTMPRGIVLGLLIAIGFYLLTNLAVFVAVPWPRLGQSSAPLALALASIVPTFGFVAAVGRDFMGLGAIISIGGVDQATTLGTAELAADLARTGVFPRFLGHESRRYRTPTLAVLAQSLTALLASLVLDLQRLVDVAVVFLLLVYAGTALATIVLRRRAPARTLRVPGMPLIPFVAVAAVVALGVSVPRSDLLIGTASLLAVGITSLIAHWFSRYAGSGGRRHQG